MKLSIKLFTNGKLGSKGYPVKLVYYHNGLIKRSNLNMWSLPENWDFQKEMPIYESPDFDVYYPKLKNYKAIIKKIEVEGVTDWDDIQKMIFGETKEVILLQDFVNKIVTKKRKLNKHAYADLIEQVTRIWIVQIPNLKLHEITSKTVSKFRENIEGTVSNSTLHNYIRTMRTIYNIAVDNEIISDTQPFKNALRGLSVRSHRTAKKYLDIEDVELIKSIDLPNMQGVYRDMFVLQFLFGGQDLKDIYYLKNEQIHNGRVFFRRAKLNDKGYEFDLLIVEYAQKLLDKYNTGKDYVFEFPKDYTYYKQFRSRYQRGLKEIQNKLQIEVKPKGGNIGVKVARHTFANRGKRLYIDPDLLRELMGHERDDIDNYYKDRYPQCDRDESLIKIITP